MVNFMKKKMILIDIIKNALNISNDIKIKYFDIRKILKYINFDNEILKIGSGTYSHVYKIGDKVLKIGLAKLNEKIIKSPFIVKTYFKKNILIKSKKLKLIIGIEIQEYAKKIIISETELYKFYETVRDNGIIWRDVKPENIGVLNNKIVIIDTDYIYKKGKNKSNIQFFSALDKKFDFIYYNNIRNNRRK